MRSFCNYKADQFTTDIVHIPWDTVHQHQSENMTQTKTIYHGGHKGYDERKGLSAPHSAKDGDQEGLESL